MKIIFAKHSGYFMPAETWVRKENIVSIMLILIFVILMDGILATGCFFNRHCEKDYRTMDRELSAIAALGVNELMKWRSERIGTAIINYLYAADRGVQP